MYVVSESHCDVVTPSFHGKIISSSNRYLVIKTGHFRISHLKIIDQDIKDNKIFLYSCLNSISILDSAVFQYFQLSANFVFQN